MNATLPKNSLPLDWQKSFSLKKVELLKENIKIYGDNEKYNPITIKKERVKVIAKMIGLIRNY